MSTREMLTWAAVPVLTLGLTGCLSGGGGSDSGSATTQQDQAGAGRQGSGSGSDTVAGGGESSGDTSGAHGGEEDESQGLAITSRTPADGANDVALLPNISATFNNALDESTVDERTFVLASPHGTVTPKQVFADGKEAHFVLDGELALATGYRAKLNAPEDPRIQDVDGNVLNGLHPWHFTTRDGQWQSPYTVGSIDTVTWSARDIEFDAAGNGFALLTTTTGGPGRLWSMRYTAGSGWSEPHVIADDAWLLWHDVELEVADDGRALILAEHSDDTPTFVWAYTYRPGEGWSEGKMIGRGTGGLELVMDGEGDALAAWPRTDTDNDPVRDIPDNEPAGILLARFNWESGWSGPEPMSLRRQVGFADVELDQTPDGQAVLLWADESLAVRHYSPGGGWQAQMELIPADGLDGDAGVERVEAGVDEQGNASVLAVSGHRIYNLRYAPDEGWSEPALLFEGGADQRVALGPLKMNNKGRAVVPYAVADGYYDQTLDVHMLNLVGSWRDSGVLTQIPRRTFWSVDIDGAGNGMFLWGCPQPGTTADGARDVCASRYANRWSEPARIEHRVETATHPVVELKNDTGVGHALWLHSLHPEGRDTRLDVTTTVFE